MTTFASRPPRWVRPVVVPDPPRPEPDEVLVEMLRENHSRLTRETGSRLVASLLQDYHYTYPGLVRLTGVAEHRIRHWARVAGVSLAGSRPQSDLLERLANLGGGFSNQEAARRLRVTQRTVERARAKLRAQAEESPEESR